MAERLAIGGLFAGSVTVTLTVAVAVNEPSLTVYMKESGPVKQLAGVYRTVLFGPLPTIATEP